ncbi:hypothetical protein [Micromonospora deserti]|uniref:Uncharacterized protein n=1 Tax=Micromonospora deserti TaxID=2070366 RepID=A0A2W2CUH1_9ACTN|nr:hypothetical protein [Micromonospora deserti]PZG01521.1 hypothetical protein C1I99_06860 [Micromonospora deserti]
MVAASVSRPGDRASHRASNRRGVSLTVAGPALFLAGRVALPAIIYRRLSWPRFLGLPALLVIALAGRAVPLLVVAAATVGVLLVVAVLDRGLAPTEPEPRRRR